MNNSPFLDPTAVQWAWDSTSLGYLKTCPRLYQYVMLEGWDSKDESIHLRFGIEYHAALEMYDRSRAAGLDHNDAVHDVIRETLYRVENWDPDPTSRPGQYKNRHTLVRTIVWYLDHYKDDKAQTYIRPDGTPAVELSFRFELDWGPTKDQPYVLSGHLDKVVNYFDNLFVMDRKTTTSAIQYDSYWNQWEPNNQMTLYSLAAKVILDAPIKGVIIDAAQVAKDHSKFERRTTYRSPDQLDEWISDLHSWFSLAQRYAEEGRWPRNDMACDKYGGCRFRQICSKSPAVRDRFLAADFIQKPEEERWNPLRTR